VATYSVVFLEKINEKLMAKAFLNFIAKTAFFGV